MMEKSKSKRKPTSRVEYSGSVKRLRESIHNRRSKKSCSHRSYQLKMQQRSGRVLSKEMVTLCMGGWKKRQESLLYIVQEDFKRLADVMEEKQCSFNQLFEAVASTPTPLRLYYKQRMAIETLIVMDLVLGYIKHWDKHLKDPLWEGLSFKIRKYRPFLSITTNKYKKLMKETFL